MKKVKVTAFLDIFEQKLERMIKKIKQHRQDGDPFAAKSVLKEAKNLRDLIKTAREDNE